MSSNSNFKSSGRWPTRAMPEAVKRAKEDEDVWLLSKEAARHLRMSPRTLERWRVQGGGPPFTKLGAGKRARVLYRLRDLDAWLARHRYHSTSEYGARQREDDG
jgi:hypothetical protein